MIFCFKKGIAVYLVVVAGALILAVVLGLSSLLVRQQVVTNQLNESVNSFHAADSGIERILYAIRKEGYDPSDCVPTPCQTPYPQGSDPSFTNGASYEIYVQGTDPSTTIRSLGSYHQTRRAIEISY